MKRYRRISTGKVLFVSFCIHLCFGQLVGSSEGSNVMRLIATFAFVFFATPALSAPQNHNTTPVPILKQINRHNDDGSYSYGYEGADGTYKIETKYPTGEVYGKYGYIGDDGKLREVEYGASKRGFEPTGSHINVAPPTLSNSIDTNNADYDDGEYREDPSVYYKKSGGSRFQTTPVKNAFTNKFQSPAYQQQYYQPQYYQPQQQFYQPRTQYQFYSPQPRFPAFTFDPAIFSGHPATNFDINTGSYSISY